MHTYQDLTALGENEQARIDFVHQIINEHLGSPLYEKAAIGDEYIRGQNREAKRYQKMLTTSTGKKVVDEWSPNNKAARNIFRRLVWEEVQYLLGNGIKWLNDGTKDKIGKDFDNRVRECARYAKTAGVCFGYFNYDHLEIFPVKSDTGGFAPLYDEENGALRAGVRFWDKFSVIENKTKRTTRATLYEENGLTEIMWNDEHPNGIILKDKTAYITKITSSGIDGDTVYDGANYPTFPIVPFWGNTLKESELFLGIKDLIDAYDRISNGYLNDLDNAQIYWLIQNAGGMDNEDIAKVLDQLRALQAASVEDGQITPVTVNIPYAARETLLQRLESAIYDDYMGLNIKNVVSGASTATQIRAAYEPVNTKSADFEECVLDFLYGIMTIAGIDDDPTFDATPIVNVTEETTTLLQAAQYLPADYVTREILYLRGDGDQAEDILAQMDKENLQRMSGIGLENEDEKEETENTDETADNGE